MSGPPDDDPPTTFQELPANDMDLPIIRAGEAQLTVSRLLDQLVHSMMLVEATAMSLTRRPARSQASSAKRPSAHPTPWRAHDNRMGRSRRT